MAALSEYRNQFKKLLDKLTTVQKVSFAALSVVLVIGFFLLMSWASRPQYAVLFSNLTPKDAGRIVEELKTAKVLYKVESAGSTIMVPENVVYEERMRFANLGIPMEGIVGYELFDQTKLGMTDFVQKLNYHRALEGELARTLTSINEIIQARVHIVIPKPALFEEDKKPTTASVTLRSKGGVSLDREQVRGIAFLVSSSVEGLTPENITIIDSRGNVLSSELGKDKAVALSASQHELQQQVELYLEEKAQSILKEALGSQKSIVRISADLNFDRIESTSEEFDPESQVIRSEEVSTKSASGSSNNPQPPVEANIAATSNTQEDGESTVTNYEISNTIKHVVSAMGNIKRLTVAVLVDGEYREVEAEGGEPVLEFMERSDAELNTLAAIVRNAVGFSGARGDQISVSCLPFDTSRQREIEAEFASAARYEFWQEMIQRGLLALIALAILLTIRSLVRRAKRLTPVAGPARTVQMEIPGVGTVAAEEAEEQLAKIRRKMRRKPGSIEDEFTDETLERADLQEKLAKFIQDYPDQATQLVRTWIFEER